MIMKKLFVVVIMLAAINASAQWVLNYTDTTFYFQDVQFSSSNTGWVAGHKSYLNGTTEGKLLKTTNAGGNWVVQNISLIPGLWGIHFIDDITGWIVGDKGVVRKTTNSGLNWVQQITDSTDNLNQVFFLNPNTGWISGLYIYKTTNGGNNWIKGSYINAFAINFLNDNTGFITAYYSHIYKTTNSGVNWNDMYAGQFHTYIYDMTFLNSNTGFAVGDDPLDGVLKTTNGGNNWIRIYNDNSELKTVYFKNINTGWVGGFSTILKTTNSGQNWLMQSLPISFYGYIWKIRKSNDSTLWSVGGKGYIFKTSNGGVGINQISTEIPSKYSLGQNYPNPFNPMCNVQFTMCNAGNVQIVVYDLMGREVQTLVNERLQPGTYETKFDGSMLNSGVYFYRLVTENFTETKKMFLIK